MSISWWALVGLFAALLVNRAADCWLTPAPLACGLTRHPARARLVLAGLPALFALLGARGAAAGDVAAAGLFAAVLILLAVIDLEQRRLPNVVVLPTAVLAVALSEERLAVALAAMLTFLVFLGLRAAGRRLYGSAALGMGDVKLAGLIGAVVGLPAAPYALLLGVLLAGGAAGALLLSGRADRGATLPYGHFLALAGVAMLVFQTWRV